MNFFKQRWVQIVAFIMVILGIVILLLAGMSVADIGKIPTLVGAIIAAIGLLITFIREHIFEKIANEYLASDKGKIVVRNTIDSEKDRKRLNPDS